MSIARISLYTGGETGLKAMVQRRPMKSIAYISLSHRVRVGVGICTQYILENDPQRSMGYDTPILSIR